MSNLSKYTHLWKSYENSVQHAFNFKRGTRRQAQVYASRTRPLTTTLITTLVICCVSVLSCALLISLPVLERYHASESALSLFERLSFLLVVYSLYFAVSVLCLALKNLFFKKLGHLADLILLLVLNLLLLPLALLYSFQPVLLVLSLAICVLLLTVGTFMFRSYSYAGLNFYLASCLGVVVGLTWSVLFFIMLPASGFTKALIFCSAPFLLIIVPSKFLHMLELYDVVCRDHWRRPRHPFPQLLGAHEPFVSIHVPTYSEPPDLVIKTLNSLAEINYTNYEVIVIDNNTEDPNLWLPVKTHCETLGPQFRFMHAEGLKGAKGGALNYIHKLIDPRAEIIGVIDADYLPDKDFLKSLVGHFADPKIGFIQTPHDYRAWRDNLFLTMCYWEYKIFFHTAMISLNERDAGITVGTMCLVRKEALEKAGGWSEWCVTEDSELAIRIHDQGYSSIYIDKTYGRGLIPDSFEGYKKQRYRWTAGPVQEFRHYYKHFIGLSGESSKFTLIQRLFHLNHGLGNALLAFNIPFILLSAGIVASMIVQNEIVAVPFELWITATITLLSAPLLTFLMYRVTVKATVIDIISLTIAAQALSHVISQAALRTAITGSAQWNRTNKFKSTQSYRTALFATKEETIIGLCLVAFVLTAYLLFPYQGLTLMLLIGLVYISLGYFAAPVMGLVGVWSFKKQSARHLAE